VLGLGLGLGLGCLPRPFFVLIVRLLWVNWSVCTRDITQNKSAKLETDN